MSDKYNYMLLLIGMSISAYAGEADVLSVKADCTVDNICMISVTVRHADTGWTHYADAWEVLTPDGELLASRVLAHPHVNERPVTRSLPRVPVPADLDSVVVRAHDSVHGYGGREVRLKLSRPLKQ